MDAIHDMDNSGTLIVFVFIGLIIVAAIVFIFLRMGYSISQEERRLREQHDTHTSVSNPSVVTAWPTDTPEIPPVEGDTQPFQPRGVPGLGPMERPARIEWGDEISGSDANSRPHPPIEWGEIQELGASLPIRLPVERSHTATDEILRCLVCRNPLGDDLDQIYQCPICQTAFHLTCWHEELQQQCPVTHRTN